MGKSTKNDDSSHIPFGGIFGNAVIIRVLEQLVADPNASYSLSILSKLTKSSIPQVKESMEQLESIGFVKMTSKSTKRPIFEVNKECNRFTALTLFAYSVVDDAFASNIMKDALRELCPMRQVSMIIELPNTTTSPSHTMPFTKPIEHNPFDNSTTPMVTIEDKENG